jgi:hypothetical protein
MKPTYINVCARSQSLWQACDNRDHSRPKYIWSVPKGTPVVYFLFSDSYGIVYIGQTTNLYQRISSHKATKQFDDVYWKSIPIEISNHIRELETLCLLYLNNKTQYNKLYPDKFKRYNKPPKDNPIESFVFAKWVDEKIKENKYREERLRQIESKYIIKQVKKRKGREKKILCVH